MTTPAARTAGFGARLRAATAERGALCVGIDPHPELLASWRLPDSPEGLERFALSTVEALGDRVAALKPQSAFFERHGSRGVAVLERVLARSRAAGAVVLLDVKRGDIGSTALAYADAYLDPASPLAADAVTVSPYLGTGSLTPLVERAHRHGAGVFVLALTSNPEGAEIQSARTGTGRTVAGTVLRAVAGHNRGAVPLGSVGAVVGATIGHSAEDFDLNGPILVPGIGAQGGTAADVRRIFGAAVGNVLPSTSRDVARAGPGAAGLRGAAARAAEGFADLLAP